MKPINFLIVYWIAHTFQSWPGTCRWRGVWWVTPDEGRSLVQESRGRQSQHRWQNFNCKFL